MVIFRRARSSTRFCRRSGASCGAWWPRPGHGLRRSVATPNRPRGWWNRTWTRTETSGKMAKNGETMAKNGEKWWKMAKNGEKWQKLVKQLVKIGENWWTIGENWWKNGEHMVKTKENSGILDGIWSWFIYSSCISMDFEVLI
jgi:hypothetical protein